LTAFPRNARRVSDESGWGELVFKFGFVFMIGRRV
jgi:hypothetical protein